MKITSCNPRFRRIRGKGICFQSQKNRNPAEKSPIKTSPPLSNNFLLHPRNFIRSQIRSKSEQLRKKTGEKEWHRNSQKPFNSRGTLGGRGKRRGGQGGYILAGNTNQEGTELQVEGAEKGEKHARFANSINRRWLPLFWFSLVFQQYLRPRLKPFFVSLCTRFQFYSIQEKSSPFCGTLYCLQFFFGFLHSFRIFFYEYCRI